MRKHLLSGAILMALSLSFASYAMAADVNVNTTNALADAVANAADGDVIHVAAGTYKIDDELSVNGINISIIGNGKVVLDGQNKTRILAVSNGGLTAENLIIENGHIDDSGDNNKGAGIRVNDGKLKISNCKFVNNTIVGMDGDKTGGAAINSARSEITLSHTDFIGGSAYKGGAITLYDSSIDAKYCLFDGNKTVYADGGKRDDSKGGAIYVVTDGRQWKQVFEHCVFKDNVSWGYGGAVSYLIYDGATDSQEVTYRGCTFVRNRTHIDDLDNPVRTEENNGLQGGAIYISSEGNTHMNFYSCTIAQNYSSVVGGALAIAQFKKNKNAKLQFVNCTITDNHNLDNAGNGGSVWIQNNTGIDGIYFVNTILTGSYSMKIQDEGYSDNPQKHWEYSDLTTTDDTDFGKISLNNTVVGYLNNGDKYEGDYTNLKILRQEGNVWVDGETAENLRGELAAYNETYYAYPFSISASTWFEDELGDMDLAKEMGCPTDQFGADWTVNCIGSVQTDEDGLEEIAAPVFYQEASSTGIKGISSATEKVSDDAYYTLDGRRVAAPAQKGIYIHNGKKGLNK